MSTPEEYLRQAFAALLRGDTAERDRLCELALQAYAARDRLLKLDQSDPVTKN